jgi:hypothetical protein
MIAHITFHESKFARDQKTQTYVAEASDLGLPVGVFPPLVTIARPDASLHEFRKVQVTPDAVMYRSESGWKLHLLND